MKKKNGFVFVETMIVVVVLIALLLILYSSYAGLISNERRRARYDDPAFIYKTYVAAKFLMSLSDDDGNAIIANKIEQNKIDITKNKEGKFVIISPEDADLFNEEYNTGQNAARKNYFSRLYNEFHIQSILLINENQIKKIKEESVSSDLYRYLQSLEINSEGNEYYFVFMFAEKVNGEECDPNQFVGNNQDSLNPTQKERSCTFYYSSLKVNGGSES